MVLWFHHKKQHFAVLWEVIQAHHRDLTLQLWIQHRRVSHVEEKQDPCFQQHKWEILQSQMYMS